MLQPNSNRANGSWKKKTGLEKKLIIYSVISTLIALVLVVIYFYTSRSSSDDVCTTKFCVKSASEVLEFVDLKKDPCNNFYDFVCGSYTKHAVKRNRISPFVSLRDELNQELKSIIVDPIRKKDSNIQKLAKQFYHECMNVTKIDLDDNRAFLRAIHELGGWPLLNLTKWNDDDFDWVDWYIKSVKLGLPIIGFFKFTVGELEEDIPILEVSGVSETSFSYMPKYMFNIVMHKVVEYLSNSTTFAVDENEKVHAFIGKLRKLSATSSEKKENKTLEDLYNDCPFVPWLKLLNSISSNETYFTNSSQVLYGDIDSYCQSLSSLINSTNASTLANYYVWSILHRVYQYLNSSIRKTYRDISSSYSPRYEVCFQQTDEAFKFVKETVYTRRRASSLVKTDLTEMINIMQEVFIEHLKTCDWMDQKTKSLAIKKTEQIKIMIGADDKLYDEDYFDTVLGLDGLHFKTNNLFEMAQQRMKKFNQHFFKTLYIKPDDDWPEFFEHAIKPNAYFVPPLNTMILPAPILSSIFYDHRKPAVMNYGSIGRIIAHEIMHGFEKTGRFVFYDETHMINWWTNVTERCYDKKVGCLIDMYEQIPFRYKLNGTLTLDENVSDFVGIDVAYEAYQRYIKRYGKDKKLPGVPLTPNQIYWVQTGTFLCFKKLDDNSVDFEEEDEHAIPAFRVEGGARNSLHFAKDFNCPAGSAMNPLDKCRIL